MHTMTRRQMLHAAGAGAAALLWSPLTRLAAADQKLYTLPPLPYAYDALKKSIDEETMRIHHDLHHKAYVDNLNNALKDSPDLQGKPIEELLRGIDKVPEKIRQAVINNGGGHANHTMFWEIMAPDGGGKPSGELGKAIDDTFGGFDKFQEKMSTAAATRFGSGWAWLVVDKGKLDVLSTANQDSPLMKGQVPVLGLDVWEHAYYLRYKNKRADYVKAWWDVVSWKNVAMKYDKAKKG